MALVVSLTPNSDDDTVFLETASGEIRVSVIATKGQRIRLAIECPRDVPVHRAKVRRARAIEHFLRMIEVE